MTTKNFDDLSAQPGPIQFADVVTYLDILAMRAGIDLGEATVLKFNEVSERVGSDVCIAALPGGALVAGYVPAPPEQAP